MWEIRASLGFIKKIYTVIFNVVSQNFPNITDLTTENFSQYSLSPGRDSIPGLPNYKAGVLGNPLESSALGNKLPSIFIIDFSKSQHHSKRGRV
jgi:hypothetical protein